jgi:hypothetical protein
MVGRSTWGSGDEGEASNGRGNGTADNADDTDKDQTIRVIRAVRG